MRRFQGILHLLWTHGMCLFKNSYVEALNTQCVFRKELGLDKVMKMGPRDGISALIKGDTREFALSPCAYTRERPCKDTAQGRPSASQEENPH